MVMVNFYQTMNFYESVAFAIAVIAVICDLHSRRIPNLLTFGAAFAGIAIHGYYSGISGVTSALIGWVAGAAIFFPVFALGGMGGGDIKLLAMIGAWLGAIGVIQTILVAPLAGLLLGLGWTLVQRRFDAPFGFAPAIAVGAIAVVLFPGLGLLSL